MRWEGCNTNYTNNKIRNKVDITGILSVKKNLNFFMFVRWRTRGYPVAVEWR